MNGVLSVRLQIDAIEERLIISDVVERAKLGCVQKTPAANAIRGKEIPESRVPETQPEGCGRGSERAVRRVHVPKSMRHAQPAPCRDAGDQAGLIAEFRIGRSGAEFHALNRAGRKLCREDLALLIADRLAVDHEADLRMIAQRVEESIGVGRDSAGAINDGLAQAAAGVDIGKLRNQAAVGIYVRGGIELQHVGSGGFDVHGGLGTNQRESRRDLHGDGVAHRDVLREHQETGRGDFQMIRIRRNVADPVRSLGAGGDGLRIAGNSVANRNRRARHGGPARVHHGTGDCAGVSQRLRGQVATRQNQSEESLHTVQYREIEGFSLREVYEWADLPVSGINFSTSG